ncbi:hypothetical protein XENTR_v10006332 [Xenopus tropicalis]|nr:hypothetical protein XENTR_v10006332 [Xenopus tropicalis]
MGYTGNGETRKDAWSRKERILSSTDTRKGPLLKLLPTAAQLNIAWIWITSLLHFLGCLLFLLFAKFLHHFNKKQRLNTSRLVKYLYWWVHYWRV